MGRWQDIQAKKDKTDAARAKVFTKIGREIAVAIKEGGGANVETNSKLREAVSKAKANNVPNENINRIIKKAESDGAADNYEEILYEGYGPGGIAVMVEASTNNKNRTAADIRHHFDKYGGNLGQTGCVAFMFQRYGVIEVEKGELFDEDKFVMEAIEAGADDVATEGETVLVLTSVKDFRSCSEKLSENNKLIEAEIKYIPANDAEPTNEDERANFDKLISALEGNDDVMNVYTNFSG
ncbi:MAG: YebC/PmpR family DNA-binding transcriptional regulator [Clostridiales bacterium]|jgi:YebC/PmpR family DNA-binding regulatory protein|nr:YebC/PmpR family DNA-binding transcriptional regulator [Clostridiales bacterium]